MDPRRIAELVDKARDYAAKDPEVALAQARKAAEAICRALFENEIGEPGKMMLDAMLQKLAAQKVIPPSILVPFGTIQAYGNFGSHAQSDARAVDASYVAPAMAALTAVERWYFDEYLGERPATAARSMPLPATAEPVARANPRRRWPIALAGIAVIVAGIVAWKLTRTPDASREHAAIASSAGSAVASPPATTMTRGLDVSGSAGSATEPAGSASDGPAREASAHGLTLSYRVLAIAPGTTAPVAIAPGTELRSGSRVLFEVRTSEAAHVVIAQRTHKTKETVVLFPHARIAQRNPLPAATWVRIPNDKGYRLDDQDLGTETVYLIASRGELPDLTRAISGSSHDVEQKILQIAMEKRPDCDTTKRQLTLDDDDCRVKPRGLEVDDAAADAHAVRTAPEDDRVLVPFSFKHVQ